MEIVNEHIKAIKKSLQAESNIDGNNDYNDWQALLKFNRNEPGGGFGDKDMAYEYIDKVIVGYVEELNAAQLKSLSNIVVDQQSPLLSCFESNEQELHQKDGWIWIVGVEKLLHEHLFKLVYEEAGSETYFDEHDHEMSDVLNQMSIRINQLSQMEDEKVRALAEELNFFHERLYDFT